MSLTAPANNATVSGTVPLSANASDNVGVTVVQFKVDGTALVPEDTVAPYSVVVEHHHGPKRHPHADRRSPRRRRQQRNLDGGERQSR